MLLATQQYPHVNEHLCGTMYAFKQAVILLLLPVGRRDDCLAVLQDTLMSLIFSTN